MKVSPKEPFKLVYSLFAHEYLGYLFESFVVKLGATGKLSLTHQNISSKNAAEFDKGLDESDYKIIKLMDSIQQDAITSKFSNKRLKPEEFLPKVFDKEKGDKLVQEAITQYIDGVKAKILPLLIDKEVYVMGNDGEPAGSKVELSEDKATVLFHFRKNEDNTHYFPTLKFRGEKLDFQYNGSQVICNNPAWLLVKENRIVTFEKEINGSKIRPFLRKKFIVIPEKVEETYYKNFISPLVANFDVFAKGFEIRTEQYDPVPVLEFKELIEVEAAPRDLFSQDTVVEDKPSNKIVFDLSFRYGVNKFEASGSQENSVSLEKVDGQYVFHRIKRNTDFEVSLLNLLKERGLSIKNGKAVLPKGEAFQVMNQVREELQDLNVEVVQGATSKNESVKKYFLGKSSINIEIKENKDWFDIYAIVRFGEFEIPFIKLKKLISTGKSEFKLPNGEIAVIPSEWLVQYSDLLHFSEEEGEDVRLHKHHVSLVHSLGEGNLASVSINRKLEKLKNFDHIEDYELPKNFIGELRPYQKAGYNWMKFLSDYNFGGCLADDMGLGKTIQTLALLQDQKEKGASTSLLIMPTSLVYNWEQEAAKFTPDLKVLVYTGTYRDKNIERFVNYDVILTSYGITRIDTDLLKEFYFNYIILDESQSIKNPNSNIAQSVNELNARQKLILTGTPIENSTMDLWSQMSFVNPGLLGSQSYFKKNFLTAIEKKGDASRKEKLFTLIKPFILRRNKAQVLTELPPKIEQVRYVQMSDDQEKEYEEIKSYYRNKILEEIDEKGMKKSQISILQGLTKLRQIANHPRLQDEKYGGQSGKKNDIVDMINSSIEQGHKLLVFSQFVKHLAIFQEELQERGIPYAYLDGSTKDRQKQVDKFQNDDNVSLFLISLKAGGLGLNLTKADYVFILDPWWNPAIESQAVDRAYRMGQKNTVNTYKFIAKNTVEEKILKLQQEKKQLADDLISTEEGFVKSLTQDDVRSLLS